MPTAANLLAGVFGAAVRGRNHLYDARILPARRLRGPVVSVGNLSVGGSGKTPFVILLGEMLRARGIRFDVLSRGYGRQTRGVVLVEPGGLPVDFGDEPLLIARRLGVPVVIGEDRHQAGLFAEQRFGPQLHLLDDGFQHRQLARDFDIVLVTPEDVRDRLLPAGRLREPLAALRRADAVVLMSGADPKQFPLADKPAWRVRRSILPPDNVLGRPLAFCGIARPHNFFLQLRKAGIEPVAEATFPDHYAYTEKDVRDLLFLREQSGAGGFLITEKDAVNLGGYLSALEPVAVVPVKMDWQEAPRALDVILDTLSRRGKGVS
jgi:tetraacyldisaccharide 4'-kinase